MEFNERRCHLTHGPLYTIHMFVFIEGHAWPDFQSLTIIMPHAVWPFPGNLNMETENIDDTPSYDQDESCDTDCYSDT